MLRARNGFTLKDATTPDGWTIRSGQDIVTALLSFPELETVDAGILLEILSDAIEERKEYESITDLKNYLTEYYI